jgi:acyl-CoA synthetase (AMP-forming)/AMP-acid ligase II
VSIQSGPPIQAPGDRAERLQIWHSPKPSTLLEMIAAPAASHPGVAPLWFSYDGRTSEPHTWGALWDASIAAGCRLSQLLGAAREPVLIAAPTSPAFFHAFFGVLAAGGVPVPIATPPSMNVSRLDWYQDLVARIAADAGARMLLTTSRYTPVLESCMSAAAPSLRILTIDGGTPEPASGWRPAAPLPQNLAFLQYTSGSTSNPKGVELTHANVVANMGLIGNAITAPDSVGVSWLPLYHDMGLIGAGLGALYTRVPMLLMPTTVFVKDPASWLRAISAFGATITLAPNFAFQHAVRYVNVDELASGTSLRTLATALNGAEPVDAGAVEAFEEKFAAIGLRRGTVRPVYGLAESSLAVTFSDAGEFVVDVVDADALEQEAIARPPAAASRTRRFVSVGRPLPTQELRVVDADDRPLPERHVGEVIVRGPSVMRGYYGRPADTAAALRNGFLHTGDLGYLFGGRLYLTGRSRDLIIRYGRNYYPADIEAVAGRIGSGRGASVAFSVDGDGDTRIVIVAETRVRDAAQLGELERGIKEACHAAFLFGPDEVRLVPLGTVPRTTSGKVRRDECRRLYQAAALPAIAIKRASSSAGEGG